MHFKIDELRLKYEIDDVIPDFKGDKYTTNGIAIVGQDSGITTSSKVKTVLMLDNFRASLYRYISKNILEKLNRDVEKVVAFNLIKFNFSTSIRKIAKTEGYSFYKFTDYLAEQSYQTFLRKLKDYKPKYLITLGKPVFHFLCKKSKEHLELKKIFPTQIKIEIENHKFILIPCVHMNTYNIYRRVYGKQDQRLKRLAKLVEQ